MLYHDFQTTALEGYNCTLENKAMFYTDFLHEKIVDEIENDIKKIVDKILENEKEKYKITTEFFHKHDVSLDDDSIRREQIEEFIYDYVFDIMLEREFFDSFNFIGDKVDFYEICENIYEYDYVGNISEYYDYDEKEYIVACLNNHLQIKEMYKSVIEYIVDRKCVEFIDEIYAEFESQRQDIIAENEEARRFNTKYIQYFMDEVDE